MTDNKNNIQDPTGNLETQGETEKPDVSIVSEKARSSDGEVGIFNSENVRESEESGETIASRDASDIQGNTKTTIRGNTAEEDLEEDVLQAEKMQFPEAGPSGDPENKGNWNINLLLDVELPVRVSFGQTEMQLRDVFKLGAGSIIELDKSVNDPVSVIVNNKPIARGEVVMVDGNYGVRILEVESTADRIRSLG